MAKALINTLGLVALTSVSFINIAYANSPNTDQYKCLGLDKQLLIEHSPQDNKATFFLNGKKFNTNNIDTGIFNNAKLGYRAFIEKDGVSISINDMMLVCQPTKAKVTPSQKQLTKTIAKPKSLENTGRSYGGKIRSGPGVKYRQTGSLFYNNKIKIIADSGISFNGYNWFKVEYGNKTGYQWGGLICSNGTLLPNIFKQCPTQPKAIKQNNKADKWFVFAKDKQLNWGLGFATTKSAATKSALRDCVGSNCKVNFTTQAKCVAITTGTNSNYIGAGDDRDDALNFAYGFCTRSGQACRLDYDICQ